MVLCAQRNDGLRGLAKKDYKRLLEQESILDKIKAEIDAQIDMYDTPCEIDGGIDESFCNGLNKAKKIIDKYKAESEK